MNKIKKTLKYVLIPIVLIVTFGYFIFVSNDYATFYHARRAKIDSVRELKTFLGERIVGDEEQDILVHREFLTYMRKLDRIAEKHDVTLLVLNSYFKPGNYVNDFHVPPARYSNHYAGFAFDADIVYKDERFRFPHLRKSRMRHLPDAVSGFLNEVREDPDIRWGGDFKTEEPVHYDVALSSKDPILWNEYKMAIESEMEIEHYNLSGSFARYFRVINQTIFGSVEDAKDDIL